MKNIKLKSIIFLVLVSTLLPLCVSSCAIRRGAGNVASSEMANIEPETPPDPGDSNASLPLFDIADSPPSPSEDPVESPDTPEPPVEETTPEPEPIKVLPVWMYIPAIGVDAEIKDTGTDYAHDTMEIYPSGNIISWWRGSAIPGNKGNAIMGGHNKWSGAYGQLYPLDTLEIGDEMEIVYADGTSLIFRLESVFVYLLATAPADVIMDVSGEARVTIITCKEPFNPNTGTSDNRIIAIFKEESVFEIPDPPIEPFPLRERG